MEEDMSFEILEAIRDTYDDKTESSNELIAKCMFYLYHTSDNEKLRQGCVEIMNDLNYCIQCGLKMQYYQWEESRPIGAEILGCYDCPNCNSEVFV